MSIGKRIRKKIKEYGRKALSVHAKASRVLRPVAAAAAGYFAGPIGAAAVTGLTHYGHQYQEASRLRGQGIRGREARSEARTRAQRTTKHSLVAGAFGAVGSGVTSALAGGNFFGGAAAGQGGAALFGGNTIFGSAAAGSVTNAITGGASGIAGIQSVQQWTGAGQQNAPTEPVDGLQTWEDLLAAVAEGATRGLGPGESSPDNPDDGPTDEERERLGIPSFANSPTDGEKPAWVLPVAAGLVFLALVA